MKKIPKNPHGILATSEETSFGIDVTPRSRHFRAFPTETQGFRHLHVKTNISLFFGIFKQIMGLFQISLLLLLVKLSVSVWVGLRFQNDSKYPRVRGHVSDKCQFPSKIDNKWDGSTQLLPFREDKGPNCPKKKRKVKGHGVTAL